MAKKLEICCTKPISRETLASGIDFLGWVNFFDYGTLRTATKKRMIRKLATNPIEGTVNSYLGLLRHGNSWGIKRRLNLFQS